MRLLTGSGVASVVANGSGERGIEFHQDGAVERGRRQQPQLRGRIGQAEQRDDLDLLKYLNEQRAALYPDDTELEARLRSYELAYRMESTAPEAVDLSKESDATKTLYGLDDAKTMDYGTNLLRARRLVPSRAAVR